MIAGRGAKLVARGFSVYFATGLVNSAIPFLLLPLMTSYLSPKEYGTLAMYQALLAFFTPVVGMNANTLIVRNFYGAAKEKLAAIVFHLLVAISIVSLIVMLILALLLTFVGGLFEIPPGWIMAMPLVAFMQMVNKCNLTVYRCRHRAGIFGLLEIGRTVVNVSVSVWLVVWMSAGWEGRAAGIVSAVFLFGGLGFVIMMRADLIRREFSRDTLAEVYRVCLPLIFHGLGAVLIGVMDRIFIDRMLGKESVGIYTVGYTFGAVTMLLTNAFNSSWSPWMQEQLSDISDKKKYQIVRFTYAYKLVVIIVALAVTGMSHIVMPIMTDAAYHVGVQVVLWVALGYAVRGMYSMYFGYLVHVGKTSVFAWVMLAGGLVNALANYWLIPVNGIAGAAQATILAWLFNYLAVWWFAAKVYPMPWTLQAKEIT